MGGFETYGKLIIFLSLGLLVGCDTWEEKYHVETGKISGANGELKNFYQCFDEECGSYSASPTLQEVRIGELTIQFAESNLLVKDVLIVGDEAFLLILNNFGYHLARVCREGTIEYATDLHEVAVGDLYSIEGRHESKTITFTIDYGPHAGSTERDVLIKSVISERAFDGCGNAVSQ